ncbi:protein FAM98A isoform X2 [Contarinia nasturtii]|uniref:protein FAM98A isoform X2 n=1 Tax=Contarinia nasturtii TaxID=265458 RepID=UPI0012D37695|nr:protein FAM98A isoform X2 [Contarinia nasturtii]
MQEIIEFLNSVGYHGECIQMSFIENMLENGISSPNFRSLVSWLSGELSILQNVDERIDPESEKTEFILELSSMLKELCCPYPVLISGSLAQRFQSKHDCLLLLNYLISELMAAKMCHKINPHKKVVIEILESSAAIALKAITQNLNLGKPPQSITPKFFFEKLLFTFSEIFKKNDKSLYMPSRQLSIEEWKKLEKLQNELDIEYDLRREMLMTRLDVTIQSFQWSDVMKNESDFIAESYTSKRHELDQILTRSKTTDIVELLAARMEMLHVEKTSSTTVRKNTQLDIQKHIIGSVPDRGGRTNEMQRPPPEMPSWQKNRSQGGQGGNSGGGANRGLNYKPQQQRTYQGSYQNSGNNFKPQKTGSANRNCANHNRVQGNHTNQLRNDNYYSGGNSGSGSNRNSFYGQDQSSQDLNQRGERRGDGYSRGQSNYNRGRR